MFVLACLAAQGIEWLAARATHESEGSGHSLIEATGLYQALVTRARDPSVRYTTLVVIDPQHDLEEVSTRDVCNEREFLAAMLSQLARAGASMVVIDKFFGAKSCPNASSSKKLQDAIAHLRKGEPLGASEPALAPMPIIIGERALEAEQTQRKLPDVTSYLEDALPLSTGGLELQQGLANVAHDHRRLPLRWTVYKDEKSAQAGTVVEVDGLALAAARARNPGLLETNARLRDLLLSGGQPYIGFLLPQDFKREFHYASEAVCKRRAISEDWATCAARTPPPSFAHGRVVLVGEEDIGDRQSTIVGPMMGYYLQANYLEALLDDRFLAPVHPSINLAISLLFLVLLELVLTLFHDSPVKAVFWVLVLGVSTVVVILQFIMYAKIYVDPSLVTASYVFLRLSHLAYGVISKPHLQHGSVVPAPAKDPTATQLSPAVPPTSASTAPPLPSPDAPIHAPRDPDGIELEGG